MITYYIKDSLFYFINRVGRVGGINIIFIVGMYYIITMPPMTISKYATGLNFIPIHTNIGHFPTIP